MILTSQGAWVLGGVEPVLRVVFKTRVSVPAPLVTCCDPQYAELRVPSTRHARLPEQALQLLNTLHTHHPHARTRTLRALTLRTRTTHTSCTRTLRIRTRTTHTDSLKEKCRERQSPRAVSHASRLLLQLLLGRDHAEHEGEPIEIQQDRERRRGRRHREREPCGMAPIKPIPEGHEERNR